MYKYCDLFRKISAGCHTINYYMVSKLQEKIKSFFEDNKSDLFVAAAVFLVGLGGFGLGRLSAKWPEKKPIVIENSELGSMNQALKQAKIATDGKTPNSSSVNPDSRGKYVASKSGTAYHFPWCAGAQKIKETNKIWFQTKEEAEGRGYKPAGNCEGL